MNLIQQRLDNAKQMLENSVTLGDRSRALAELEVWQERLDRDRLMELIFPNHAPAWHRAQRTI